MNKGYLGAVLVAVFFLLLLWRLAKHRHATEVLCLVALTLYLFMENKPFFAFGRPVFCCWPLCVFWQRQNQRRTAFAGGMPAGERPVTHF